MAKVNAGPSIYIPTDKNIFDALQHKKVTQNELVSFLRKRGVLVSNNVSKQGLTEKISSLTLSYTDFNWIGKLLENPNRKDKTTHSKLKGDINVKQITNACATVKAQLTASGDDSVKVTKSGDKTTLTVTYVDHDFTKTELRQRTIKTCEIQIEQGGEGVVMKLPSTKKAKEVSEQFKAVLKAQVIQDSGEELEEFSISLESLADATIRSKFFDYLIRNVPGFEFDNVSSVDVYHFEQEQRDEFEDDDGAEARLASYINKAALAGEGVLESTEFKQLHKRGFYIYKIVWTAKDTSFEGAKVEFEARFGKPDLCTEFMYTVRGVYPYNSRTLDYNVTRKSATPYENDKYNVKLRDASEKALQVAISEYGE
ncbi:MULTISPECIES: hypothetical protein [Vibrio]|uniref:hypothetical protein n=1 Tax=Vibrio TaxID=662 RepID=UPI0020BF7E76|nr:hypothetical protein [Vibrio sp. 1CM23M]MCK8069830.1 hypothetical protein [Vibrio sp. 1CM23M]